MLSFELVIILGVLQADPGVIREKEQIFRLFCHEAQRVFHDRLINNEDKTYFNEMLGEMAQKHFQTVRRSFSNCCTLEIFFFTSWI